MISRGNFGLDKSVNATFVCGKHKEAHYNELYIDSSIKELDSRRYYYKFMEINEREIIQHAIMKKIYKIIITRD